MVNTETIIDRQDVSIRRMRDDVRDYRLIQAVGVPAVSGPVVRRGTSGEDSHVAERNRIPTGVASQ